MARFYLCRVCGAHIAWSSDFEYCFSLNGTTGGIFQNLSSVLAGSQTNDRTVGGHTITDVYCNNCCTLLGSKFIEVPKSEGGPSEGDFLLPLTNLLMWDGRQFVDAQTEELLAAPDSAIFGYGRITNGYSLSKEPALSVF